MGACVRCVSFLEDQRKLSSYKSQYSVVSRNRKLKIFPQSFFDSRRKKETKLFYCCFKMAWISALPIFLLIGFIEANQGGYLRGEQDPFLQGWECRPQVNKKANWIPDPQMCDRYLLCLAGAKIGFSSICPKGQGFNDETKTCENLDSNGKLQSCEKRQATMFMDNKPDVRCDLEADEAAGLTIHKDGVHYYKKLDGFSHAFVWCKKSKIPLIMECHDPRMPDMDLDVAGYRKCFKSGHNEKVSIKYFL